MDAVDVSSVGVEPAISVTVLPLEEEVVSVVGGEEEDVPTTLERYVYSDTFPGRRRCSVLGNLVASLATALRNLSVSLLPVTRSSNWHTNV